MTKEIQTKKTFKQHIKEAGLLYLFLSNLGATMYLVAVRIPDMPVWATAPISLGTAISAGIAWYNR